MIKVIEKLEQYGFVCEAGPLELALPWEQLKEKAVRLEAIADAAENIGDPCDDCHMGCTAMVGECGRKNSYDKLKSALRAGGR